MIPGRKYLLLALLASILVHLAVAMGTSAYHPPLGAIKLKEPVQLLDSRLVARMQPAQRSAAIPVPAQAKAGASLAAVSAKPAQPAAAAAMKPAERPVANPPPMDEAATTPASDETALPAADAQGAIAPTTPADEATIQQTRPDDALLAAAKVQDAGQEAASQATAASAADKSLALPKAGRIRFVVMRGEKGFVVGQSLHQWQHDERHYQLESVTETTGLVALFRSLRAVWRSQGDILASGLQPLEFRAEKAGKREGGAHFDWPDKRLRLENGQQLDLPPQTQDVLSMFYQLSVMLPELLQAASTSHQVGNTLGKASEFELPVTTGRKLARYRFRLLGVETLELARHGRQDALHVRTLAHAGEQTIDIWLGLNTYGLPLKIRYTENNGDTYEQLATDIELSVPALGATPLSLNERST